jgi:NCS1 family nucleobase:cation symporter-1
MAAMAAGVAPIVPGFLQKVGVLPSVSKAFVTAYNNAWFVSFFVAGAVYCLLCGQREMQARPQYN